MSRGFCFFKHGEDYKAIRDFDKVLELSSTTSDLGNNTRILCNSINKNLLNSTNYTITIERKIPETFIAHFFKGKCFQNREKYDNYKLQ